MRKKLMSLQNMRSTIMQESLRKHNSDKNGEEITISDFKEKLQKFLQKLTVQTRYTNRVSQCHIKNVEQLENVKQELNHLLELRKMEETNQIMLKNLSNELAQTLNQTQEKLLIVTNELFEVKKQLKQTKFELSEMKKANQKLQIELRKAEREKYHSLIELHDREEQKPVSILIENYVKEFKFTSCEMLYQHCMETLRTKNYNFFIKGLELKMSLESKTKATQTEKKDTVKLNEKQDLKKLMIKRKISDLHASKYTSHHRTKTKMMDDPFRLPSFRMKTQGLASMPKYSVS